MSEKLSKMQWKCRRGMLELDICLNQYLKQCYEVASSDEQARFNALLEENDTDIWEWLMGSQAVAPRHQPMIEKLQQINHIALDNNDN